MEPREIAAAARSFSAMARIVGPVSTHPLILSIFLFLNPCQRLPSSPAKRHAPLPSSRTPRPSRCAATPSTSTSRGPPRCRRRPSSCRRAPWRSRRHSLPVYARPTATPGASLVEAFLVAEQRDSPTEELQPRLIPEARLGVLVEPEESGNIRHGDSGAPQWLSAELLAMVDVPASADSVLSLLTYDGSLIGSSSWDVGWPLADVNQKQVENDAVSSLEYNRKNFYAESVDPSTIAKSATRIAVLGVSALASSNAGHMNVPLMPQRGDSLLVVGSPFGIFSPFHFFNRKDLTSGRQWLFDFLSRESKVASTVLAVTCWHIWEARNNARNNSERLHPLRVAGKIKAYVEMIIQHCYKPVSSSRCESSTSRPCWVPPPVGTVCINVDAAIFANDRCMGMGVVIRDHRGRCVLAYNERFEGVTSPELAEAVAIRRALTLSRDHGHMSMLLNSDCLSVIQRIHFDAQDRSFLGSVIADIKVARG